MPARRRRTPGRRERICFLERIGVISFPHSRRNRTRGNKKAFPFGKAITLACDEVVARRSARRAASQRAWPSVEEGKREAAKDVAPRNHRIDLQDYLSE